MATYKFKRMQRIERKANYYNLMNETQRKLAELTFSD